MAAKKRTAAEVLDGKVQWLPTMKELPATERPRERLIESGAGGLSNAELIAIVLRGGVPGLPVTRLAEQLLIKHRGLSGLLRAPVSELCRERGLGTAKVAQLKAALELGRRCQLEQPDNKIVVRSPADVHNILGVEMAALEQEQFRVLLLDTKNQVIATRVLYQGSVNSSQLRVGEVFRDAVRENATALVAVHNHPSGDPTPSPEDLRVTEALVAAGRMLDIEVVDHIVIGQGQRRFESLKQRGVPFR